jgi:hypothetical protein
VRLRFIATAAGYQYAGNDRDGILEALLPLAPGTVWVNAIPITAAQSVTLTGLRSGHVYSALELNAENCETTYSGDNGGTNVTFSNNGSATLTVTNRYEPGEGILNIRKTLAGSPEDWGVDNATEFNVEIFDHGAGGTLTAPLRLRFIKTATGYQ